jgi:hypothetical protein
MKMVNEAPKLFKEWPKRRKGIEARGQLFEKEAISGSHDERNVIDSNR